MQNESCEHPADRPEKSWSKIEGENVYKIKSWPSSRKAIATVVALVVVAGLVAGGLAWSSHQTKKKCAQQVELLTAQVSQFDAVIADAKTTLELAVKLAPHADGYADSDEGKAQIDKLNKAVDKAEKSKVDSSKPGCATRNELKEITGLTGERGKAIDELNSNAEQFNESLGKWRLNKASEQAKLVWIKLKSILSRLAKMPTSS